MAAITSESELFSTVSKRFNIEELTHSQKTSILALKSGKDVFVGTKTGSGKSLTYECAPILFGENMTTIVIAPLTSIMKEQVERLSQLGFSATFIGSGNENEIDVLSGKYQFLFGSPEMFVGTDKWRNVLRSSDFLSRHCLTVVDEAHTIIQWGEDKGKEEAFRKWFSCIGEIRSLGLHVPVLALTATACPTNRRKIMKSLCFKSNQCVICDSPDRSNIKLNVKEVKNNADIDHVFKWLTTDLNRERHNFARHIIFCTRTSDISLIYMLFVKYFGHFSGLFNMYHQKTTEPVKEMIRNDMNNVNGLIRVLICSNSAGMGVNFRNLHNIIHYGPPHELDTLVQQMGRAGRDDVFSQELIIYKNHKGHLKKIDCDVVKLITNKEECRREIIASAYLSSPSKPMPIHNCCDNCEKSCKCNQPSCPVTHPGIVCINELEEETEDRQPEYLRQLTEEEKKLIEHKLSVYRESLSLCPSIIDEEIMHGLSVNTVKYIVDRAPRLFTVNDVLDCNVYSYQTACGILKLINEVTGDIDIIDSSDCDTD